MTLLAVEAAVALFQEYTMSPTQECIPCSPGRAGQSKSQAGKRQEVFPGAGQGGSSPTIMGQKQSQPPGRGRSVMCARARACMLRAKAVQSGPCVVQRGVVCVVLQSPAHLSKGC